jgi:hypothetical protein
MTLTPIQKFCLARAAKLAADIEGKKHHAEVLKLATTKGKPFIVRAEGRAFMITLHRGNLLLCSEVEDEVPEQSKASVQQTKPPKQPAVEVPITEQKRAPAAPVQSPKRLGVACSKTFAKAMTVAAHDEGWNRSQWADAVIPEAYLAWVEDGVLCDDPEAGDSQVTVMLSGEVFAQIEEVGKAMGGRGNGAAFRRLIAYSLPNGGKVCQ